MNSYRKSSEKYGLKLQVVENGQKHHRRNDRVEVAELGKEIIFNPSILDSYRYEGWGPLHHDLLVICAAAAFADKRCARRLKHWGRTFEIAIPVQEPEKWGQPNVREILSDTLSHLTGDNWHFSFAKANSSAIDSMCQRALPFDNNKEFVIAYSDGLDSRCVAGIFDVQDTAVRVRVSKTKDRVKKGEKPFDLIPFRVKPKPSPESSYRSRGFIFASITAIAAHLSGIKKIIVPESGQGALGPALLPLHNIYADYRCHPTFFRKMEALVREVLGYTVIYEQPRLWNTKGETIAAYLSQPGSDAGFVADTRSCWQQRWNARVDGVFKQCGLCAACLLRRMSLHTAGVEEPAGSYTIENLTAASYSDALPRSSRGRLSNTLREYGCVGIRHFSQLSKMAGQSLSELRPHVFQIAQATDCSEQNTYSYLSRLLNQHALEWHEFVASLGRYSFIDRWMVGGRYGRY